MRNLLRCRRGATSFAFILAAIPLIGMFGFATEGAMWYTVKRGAQNAADAAAYSGGLRLACSLATQNGGGACGDAQSVAYRGKQFAAQDAFCSPGFTSPLCRTGTSVAMDIGTFNGTSWASSAAGADVKATVTQAQPMYFVSVFKPLLGSLCSGGGCSFSINAQAVARVTNPKPICALGLGRSGSKSALTIAGNFTGGGEGCALMSDNTVKYASAPTFTGDGWAVDAVAGCIASSGHCDNPGVPYDYYMPTATNPLASLDTQSFNSITGNADACAKKVISNGDTCPITPTLLGGPAYGGLTVNGGLVTFKPTATNSTFIFYNATLNFNGGLIQWEPPPGIPSTLSGVNIVLLGNSSLTINGATVDLSANSYNTTYPALNGVLIDDQAPTKTSNNVSINGNGKTKLGGAMYFPNVDVSYGGTAASTATTCAMVIANTVTLGGGAYLNSTGCAPGTVNQTQSVQLVY